MHGIRTGTPWAGSEPAECGGARWVEDKSFPCVLGWVILMGLNIFAKCLTHGYSDALGLLVMNERQAMLQPGGWGSNLLEGGVMGRNKQDLGQVRLQ